MWFLYLLPDLARSTGAVEDPVDEADSEEDDEEESAAEGVTAADVLREQRQQQEGSMVGEGVGGAVVEVEGVEPIEDLLCRDDIAR